MAHTVNLKEKKETLPAVIQPFIPKEWHDISSLSFCELMEHMTHFANLACIESEGKNIAKASYFLIVMERYMAQARIRIVTAIE